MKEPCKNVKLLLEIINYIIHNWELCDHFKMLTSLLGQQGRYTKYCIYAFSVCGIVELIFSVIQESGGQSEKN